MKTRPSILPAVCFISLLSACASKQPVSIAPWAITPITAMNSNDKPEAMYQLGRYYQGQSRYDKAIAAYQKALAVDNGFVEARNGLGVVLSKQGKYSEAIEAFKIAIQQAPNAAHLYSNIGYAYYLQGKYAESLTVLVQATTLDPKNPRSLNNLGLAYAKAGSNVESNQAFSQAAALSALQTPSVATDTAVVETVVTPLINESPVTVTVRKVVASSEIKSAVIPQTEEQSLVLPKDRGIIRPASNPYTVPVVGSSAKLVQLEPNVYELRMRQYNMAPMPMALTSTVVLSSDYANVAKLRVEVANGNGVVGLAGKVGQFLRSQGYPVARLTNQKPFQVRITQIQYREGHQAEANLLQSNLPDSPALVMRNDLRADVGVRLVLGKDVATRTAYFDRKSVRLHLALN